jgi:TRAP-type transport system periplasmic protein
MKERNSYKPIVIGICILLWGALSIIPVHAADTKVINLTVASHITENQPWSQNMKWYCDQLTVRTGQRVQVKYYWGGSLMPAPRMLSAARDGIIDIYLGAIGYVPSELPLTRGVEQLYITSNYSAQAKAGMELYRTYKPMRSEWEDKMGIKLLFPDVVTTCGTVMKKPVDKMEDLKGLKIRGYGPVLLLLGKIGAVPVDIPAPDLYEALGRGVIDGASGLPFMAYPATKFYEVAPYMIDLGIGTYSFTHVAMSMKTYNRLPHDIQKVVEDVSQEALERHPDVVAQFYRSGVKQSIDAGAKLARLSDAEKNRIKSIVVPYLWEQWLQETEKKGLPGREFLDKFLELVKKYEKTSPIVDEYDLYNQLKK